MRVRAALVLLSALAGCHSDRSPGDVAGRFLDDYYVEVNQPAALALATGPAAARLRAEMADLDEARRQGVEAAPSRPHVYYEPLQKPEPPAAGRQSRKYRLSIDSGGVMLQKRVDLLLSDEGGRWRVYQFGEADLSAAP